MVLEHVAVQVTSVLGWLIHRWHNPATLSPLVVLACVLLVTVVCCVQPTWRLLRHGMTIVHEMGHAVMAWMWGRRLAGISLHTDTSGLTISSGKPRGVGVLFTSLAGYTAPPVAGLGMFWAATSGWGGAALTITVVLLCVAFWLARNAFGVLTVLAGLAVSVLILYRGSAESVALFVLAVGAFLVVAGVRGCLDLRSVHRRGEGGSSDASQAAAASLLPAALWIWFFIAVSGACAVGGVALLMGEFIAHK